MYGIGKSKFDILKKNKIFTIGDLAHFTNHKKLQTIFGKN